MCPEEVVCLTPYTDGGSASLGSTVAGAVLTDSVSEWRAGGHVLVTTARSFKGLEAPVVILFSLGETPVSAFTAADLYVGASRARALLQVITYSKSTYDYLKRLC